MKKVIFFLYLSTLVSHMNATDPPQLGTARATFQKRRADAVRPVYDAYIRELKEMERNFTLRQDLDAAIAVRNEREGVEEEIGGNLSPKNNFLTDTVWQWGGLQGNETVQFRRDGTVYNEGWNNRGLVTGWENKGGGVVLLTILKGRSNQLHAILVFAPDRRSYTGTSFEGKIITKSTRIR